MSENIEDLELEIGAGDQIVGGNAQPVTSPVPGLESDVAGEKKRVLRDLEPGPAVL